jgi:hypothetical protein
LKESAQVSLLSEIAEIRPGRAALIALIAADIVGLGVLIVFVIWRDLFLSLDLGKLLLLSAATTMPFASFGTFAYHNGVVATDSAEADRELAGSVLFAVAMHLFYGLGALAAVALSTLFPIFPEPYRFAPVSIFWGLSGAYCINMALIGAHKLNPAAKWLPMVMPALGLFGIVISIVLKVGLSLHWWQ